ncbi:MAG: DUF3501 family protein [Gammaproteobacteria bacterium]
MTKLTHEDLYGLEEYAQQRADFRAVAIAHKQRRRLDVGPNAALFFEDRLTMHYQIQEILRTERIFEPDEIQTELAVYNPLIPDGTNLKATLMLMFPDPSERREALGQLVGIEGHVWIRVDGFGRTVAIADEDLERSTSEKTSAVHFLRFEPGEKAIAAFTGGATLGVGIDHPKYRYSVQPVPEELRAALLDDFR